ncbi:unnamed protein product [Linum tenue]|uniref:RING-type domain-containing protein n=1 Tax=Linum tenue TaxID=586396 RepID=A0AAV0NQS9_9ROSI|nr:unnamed protein product [Linum tenue]CAI0461029.1 unnamed protein product [Linum tenue]
MPAQKRPLPEDSHPDDDDEEAGRGEERGDSSRRPSSSSPPHQNGNHQHHGSFPGQPPDNTVPARSQLKADEEVEDDGNEDEDDSEEEDEKQEEEAGEEEDEDPDDEEEEDEEGEEEEEKRRRGAGGDYESTQSSSSSEEEEEEEEEGDKPEFVFVELPEIRKDVQCPICLGIIKKTRTVMECLHRFCRECIDKSMRFGNKECPACRTHCASRRSLRDDPNYDALIAALYPDIDKYEEEELAFHEEERTRNKQIQASIAQIFQRQSEALARRRTIGKESTAQFASRSQRNLRTTQSRRQRNRRSMDYLGSEDMEEENNEDTVGGKDSSSADERSPEARPRRRRRRPGLRTSHQPSSSGVNSEGVAADNNDQETSRDHQGVSPVLPFINTEMLNWGRGGTRSNTRHGVASSSNNRHMRNSRILKLTEHLKNTSAEDKNEEELYLNLIVLPLGKESAPSLEQPYIRCRSTSSIGQIREFIAQKLSLAAEEVDLFLVAEFYDVLPTLETPSSKDGMRVLVNDEETLATLTIGRADFPASYVPRSYLMIAFNKKVKVEREAVASGGRMEAEASGAKEEVKEEQ